MQGVVCVFLHLHGWGFINSEWLEEASTKISQQYQDENGIVSVHMDPCDEMAFFWLWLLLQGLGDWGTRGILDFVCRKLHIPTVLTVAVLLTPGPS